MSTILTGGPIQIGIEASPKALYDHLVDLRNHAAWNHQVVEVTMTTPEPIRVGTTFEAQERAPANFPGWLEPAMMGLLRLFGRNPESRAEIVGLVPNERIEWLAQSPIRGDPDMQMRWVLSFAEEEGGTRVTQQFEMMPQGRMAKLMTNDKLAKQIVAGCSDNLTKLKFLMERAG